MNSYLSCTMFSDFQKDILGSQLVYCIWSSIRTLSLNLKLASTAFTYLAELMLSTSLPSSCVKSKIRTMANFGVKDGRVSVVAFCPYPMCMVCYNHAILLFAWKTCSTIFGDLIHTKCNFTKISCQELF